MDDSQKLEENELFRRFMEYADMRFGVFTVDERIRFRGFFDARLSDFGSGVYTEFIEQCGAAVKRGEHCDPGSHVHGLFTKGK